MLQKILAGELPHFRFDCWAKDRYLGGHLGLEIRWQWKHYHETHGLPKTPWFDQALYDVPF